jgi:hypothetical protein
VRVDLREPINLTPGPTKVQVQVPDVVAEVLRLKLAAERKRGGHRSLPLVDERKARRRLRSWFQTG